MCACLNEDDNMDFKDPVVHCASQWGSAAYRYPAHGALNKHQFAGCASPMSYKKKKTWRNLSMSYDDLGWDCKEKE